MVPFDAVDSDGLNLWGSTFALGVFEFMLRSLLYFPLVLLLVWLPCNINLMICPWVFPFLPASPTRINPLISLGCTPVALP